jgi:hypothetical protein
VAYFFIVTSKKIQLGIFYFNKYHMNKVFLENKMQLNDRIKIHFAYFYYQKGVICVLHRSLQIIGMTLV